MNHSRLLHPSLHWRRFVLLAGEAVRGAAGMAGGHPLRQIAIALALIFSLPTANAIESLVTSNGATTLSIGTGVVLNPAIAFEIAGSTHAIQSWELASGSNMPPGLTFGVPGGARITTLGSVNTDKPTLEGTPTTAGTYTIRLVAYELPNRGGLSTSTFAYTITVASTTASVPVITTQPTSQFAVPGATVTFSVSAVGALTYQWTKNGINIPGATGSILTLPSVALGDTASTYRVVVTNSAGPVTSSPATLTVTLASPTITTQPQDKTAAAGSTVIFSVTGTGALSYQWRKNGVNIPNAINSTLTLSNVSAADAGFYTVALINNTTSVVSTQAQLTVNGTAAPVIVNQPQTVAVLAGSTVAFTVSATSATTYQWTRNGINLSGATNSTLILTSVDASVAGPYRVVVGNATGVTVTSSTATLSIVSAGTLDSKLSNLSVRSHLDVGQRLTVGFVTDGPKSLLLRGVGPSLLPLGVSDYLPDPSLTIFNATGSVLAGNDTWDIGLIPTFARLGAFAFTIPSLDAALLQTVSGPSTAVIAGPGSGTVLVEVYDADLSTVPTRLVNVSARNQVGINGNILISGFIIDGSVAKTLLIRGIGPALKDLFNVSGNLVDPKLEIYTAAGTKIAENDNWDASIDPTFTKVGAYHFLSNSKDSALLLTLPPGTYTAQVSGVDGGIGEGVVEVYVVP